MHSKRGWWMKYVFPELKWFTAFIMWIVEARKPTKMNLFLKSAWKMKLYGLGFLKSKKLGAIGSIDLSISMDQLDSEVNIV